MNIIAAHPAQAHAIARLIMLAMNHDCCLHFAGEGHTLAEFESLMTRLVARDDTQYSYRNTLVAMTDEGDLAGICVSYDGAALHTLRRAFIEEVRDTFGRDFSTMDDETQTGELYIDSLAVTDIYRRQGVAEALLRATVSRAEMLCLPAVGLLVDKGNPNAERLYRRIGFRYANDAMWGGHAMRHLQIVFPRRV